MKDRKEELVMTLFRFSEVDPFQGLPSLQSELDRFLRSPLGLDLGPSGVGVFPPINVFGDRDGNVVVRAEVPGLAPGSIGISIEDRVLTITGERTEPERKNASCHRRERRFGKFSRSVQLPADLNGERATAQCKDGLLTVTIPKREEAKPKQIEVQTG
jgi:HSP20 family protein